MSCTIHPAAHQVAVSRKCGAPHAQCDARWAVSSGVLAPAPVDGRGAGASGGVAKPAPCDSAGGAGQCTGLRTERRRAGA